MNLSFLVGLNLFNFAILPQLPLAREAPIEIGFIAIFKK